MQFVLLGRPDRQAKSCLLPKREIDSVFSCHGGRVTANFGGADVVPLQGAHAPYKAMASRKSIQKNCLELLALVVDSLLWLKMKICACALSLLTIAKTSIYNSSRFPLAHCSFCGVECFLIMSVDLESRV